MDQQVSVEVDHDVCVGSGDCARIAPAAFEVDEAEGLAVVLDGAHTTGSEQLERAARECPTGAIRVSADSPPTTRATQRSSS